MIKDGFTSVSSFEPEMRTFPASGPKFYLDNIFVKGFEILDRGVHSDKTLSDHSLIWSRLKLKSEVDGR